MGARSALMKEVLWRKWPVKWRFLSKSHLSSLIVMLNCISLPMGGSQSCLLCRCEPLADGRFYIEVSYLQDCNFQGIFNMVTSAGPSQEEVLLT